MTTRTKRLAPRRDPYTEFLKSLQLFLLANVHGSFRIRRDEYLDEEETENLASLACRPIKIAEHSFDLRATLNLKLRSVKTTKVLARINATYDLHFHAKDVKPEMVRRFARSEVRLIVWPYFRELVTNISSRMHIPPLILPLSGQNADRG